MTDLEIPLDDIEIHEEACMTPASSVSEKRVIRTAQEGCRVCRVWARAMERVRADGDCSAEIVDTQQKYEGCFYTMTSSTEETEAPMRNVYDIFTDSSKCIEPTNRTIMTG